MIEKLKKIPKNSILKRDEKSFDYIDSFQGDFHTNGNSINIIQIGNLFVTCGPAWADKLMKFRDKIVGVFGLKTSNGLTEGLKTPNKSKFEIGEQLDIFKVFAKTENELILGEDDKHLSFRVSILTECNNQNPDKNRLSITTAVQYKNLFGRLYFIPVKPIHQLIVKGTLKAIIRQIEIQ